VAAWPRIPAVCTRTAAQCRAGRRLLKWLVGRGADLDVRGVALGPADTAGGQRTQNGPFTPLEWARRQGHLSCAAVRARIAYTAAIGSPCLGVCTHGDPIGRSIVSLLRACACAVIAAGLAA
jgi:hypothetical protein